MISVSIKNTEIVGGGSGYRTEGLVRLTLAGSPTNHEESISGQVFSDITMAAPIALIQIKALQRMQALIGEEVARLQANLARHSAPDADGEVENE